jgi:hypothetical protein
LLFCIIEIYGSVSDPFTLSPNPDPGMLLNMDPAGAQYGSNPDTDPDPDQDLL